MIHLNKSRIETVIYLIISFFTCIDLSAQCDDIQLTLAGVNSTCLSNGMIAVTLAGADTAGIDKNTMEFGVSGTQIIPWTHYSDDTIRNLPPGTYTISLRAFCNENNDWIVATHSAQITLLSSYTLLDAFTGTMRKTLNCIPSGMAQISVRAGTGSAPFTVTMTSFPSSYPNAYPKVFNLQRSNLYSTATLNIDSLSAGNYTFEVKDACSYTQTLNVTIGAMTQDYDANMIYTYAYPSHHTSDCNTISIIKNSTSVLADEFYYFFTNAGKYYEVGLQLNGSGQITWLDSLSLSRFNYSIPGNISLNDFRKNNYFFKTYVRVKGGSLPECLFPTNDVSIRTPKPDVSFRDITCSDVTVIHSIADHLYGVICYPYQWRIISVNGSDTTFHTIWSAVSDTAKQTTPHVPYGSMIQYEDNQGYRFVSERIAYPEAGYGSSGSPCSNQGMFNNYFPSSFYLSFNGIDSVPAGTTIHFNSGPSTPIHQDTVLAANSTPIFFPFSPNLKTSSYAAILPGIYQFEITFPGVGCTSQIVNVQHVVFKQIAPMTYTKREDCGGLTVKFTGGQLGVRNSDNTDTYLNTYFYIHSVEPNIPVDTRRVMLGDSLVLPTSGKYVVAMTYNAAVSCPTITDTIDYVKTPFTLNPLITTAYLCEGTTGVITGLIRVEGMGGSGNYYYELYDNDVLVNANNTGVFYNVTAGNTYVIKLTDIDPACAASREQSVKMINLAGAQIVYTSEPTNTFCLNDSVYLKCLTLGQTTYTWQNVNNPGVGITPANEHLQNPAIAAGDLGLGTHTFLVTVTPEGCQQMQQSVTVTVIDCSGAHDDYHTVFMNMTGTVDILANDVFPPYCAASVVPVVTVNPTKGTAQLVNNKVVYTPNLNFLGRDSLTYSTTCDTTTTFAKVYFNVIKAPDNIMVPPGCFILFKPIPFTIQKKWNSNAGTASANAGALVGDLDGDGIPEIITMDPAFNWLNIINGSTGLVKGVIQIPNAKITDDWIPVLAGVLIDSDRNGKGELIFITKNGKINSYESATSGGATITMPEKWSTSMTTYSGKVDNTPQPIVADFNGDGNPELVVYNQIFNAKTGGATLGVTEALASANVGRNINHGGSVSVNFMTTADFDGDGLPEIVAGNKIYKVNINPAGTTATCSILYQTSAFGDGFTTVADGNLDGNLDVVVVDCASSLTRINIWSPKTNQVLQQFTIPNSDSFHGVATIGDIDGVVSSDGKRYPEICLTTKRLTPSPVKGRVSAYKYNPLTQTFVLKWEFINDDISGSTGVTLFDFDHCGVNELVYRDMNNLYILDGRADSTPIIKGQQTCTAGTSFEFPVIADADGTGSAKICVTCAANGTSATNTLIVFEGAASPWAPSRKVWNQVNYEPTGINNNLTTPTWVFPKNTQINIGLNNFWPYNGALIQMPITDTDLNPVIMAPDPYIVNVTSSYLNETTIRISVVIGNQGKTNVNPSLPVSLYQDSISPGNRFATKPVGVALSPGNTVTLYFDIPVGQAKHIVYVRLQDDGSAVYPAIGAYFDCNYSNNERAIIVRKLMQKEAELNATPQNGTLSNPVATLFTENITYTITAVNANTQNGTGIVIRDTLPAYLSHVSSNPPVTPVMTGTPQRAALAWTVTGLNSLATASVSVTATPLPGVSASQPLFANRAWVTVSDTVDIPTNYTYHQGAGISLVTFSAGYGGKIYNAAQQALDYGASPYSGVVVAPDEGYRFAGWSHAAYRSLRGETIQAQNNIMQYETLTVYGDVTLRADFEPEVQSGRQMTSIEPVAENGGDKVWASGGALYVRTSMPGSIVRIYSMEGILLQQRPILQSGETSIKLPVGLYVVTLNNGVGTKIMMND
jgi:hypothetical protein